MRVSGKDVAARDRGERWRILALLAVAACLLLACRNGDEGPLPPQGEPAARARVTVEGTGLFEVDARTLASLGWSVDSPLALQFDGRALPFQVEAGGLYFYLPPTTPARYSDIHTLWLVHGEGGNTVKVPVRDSQGEGSEIGMLTRELRLSGTEQYSPKFVGDPWFWRSLVGPVSDLHELQTPGRQQGTIELEVRVAGVTNTAHRMTILLEGQEAGHLEWSGDTRHEGQITLDLPAGETLQLTIEIPEATSGADIALIDEIIVRYPSTPTLVDGLFTGSSPTAGAVQFENSGSGMIGWQIDPSLASLPATEDGSGLLVPARHRFIVAERESAVTAQVERVDASEIPAEGAEYVAIVAPSLVEAIRPLLDFHHDNDLSTLLVTPQQIYDAYSNGTVDPLAFRAFLKDGRETWSTPPRFVLLVGDSTYDPHGYQSEPPEAYVPSPFIETVFGGETVSDNVIADLDEDGYPDIALGRLPARTPQQLRAYIDKRISYSTKPEEGAWRERVLLAADGQEALFKSNSERLREGLPEALEAQTVYPAARSEALEEMLPVLNEGSLVVNYVGHGSVQQWGKDRLLTTESVSQMSNGNRLPIVINMTCLTGLFTHPTQESLAETLLWSTSGGAIAAVAPTSLTLPSNQSRLNEALFEELFAAERPTVGEALDRAKASVELHSPNDHDIVATFNLLGDPALRPAPVPGLHG